VTTQKPKQQLTKTINNNWQKL